MALVVTGHTPLPAGATNGSTSLVCEPTTDSSGSQVFVTGNWFASASVDGGANWTFVNPYKTLQPPASTEFCCDQIVLHDPRRGIWLWILQYVKDQSGSNVIRLAFTRDADFPGGWSFWEVSPKTLDASWTGVWFDYPDAALTAENLYVTFNVFNAAGQWKRAVVMRFPLATIARRGSLTVQHWSTTGAGSLRLTQGADCTMYWGSRTGLTEVTLFAWADGQTAVNTWKIPVARTNTTISSNAPNGVDWLGRADSRITGGAVAAGLITFLWTSGPDAAHAKSYIRVARISETTKQLVDQPDIWNPDNAFAFPAAAPNGSDDIGVVFFAGGASLNPTPMVGAWDGGAPFSAQPGGAPGSKSPGQGKWGDYLSCRPTSTPRGWTASGYVLKSGQSQSNVVPRVIRFELQ
jgi:hypothetical protein